MKIRTAVNSDTVSKQFSQCMSSHCVWTNSLHDPKTGIWHHHATGSNLTSSLKATPALLYKDNVTASPPAISPHTKPQCVAHPPCCPRRWVSCTPSHCKHHNIAQAGDPSIQIPHTHNTCPSVSPIWHNAAGEADLTIIVHDSAQIQQQFPLRKCVKHCTVHVFAVA